MKKHLILFVVSLSFVSNLCLAQDSTVQKSITEITFEEVSHDFGEIIEGENAIHVFKFTNTGNAPLIITDARASCGCTVPYYPKMPIMPGESSEIQVEYSSKGRPGRMAKNITIRANTQPELTVLMIRGEVIPTTDETKIAEQKTQESQQEKDKEAIEATHTNCFAIYPNPTNDILKLDLKDYIGMQANVVIHNEMGQQVLSKAINQISSETTQFNVGSYKPGIYMITIRVKDQKPMTQCFVVTGG